MAPTGAKRAEDRSMAEIFTDLWHLVRDYAKQETLDPLKTIWRFLAFGIPGALFLGLGTLFGVLAILRGLQMNDRLQGSFTWVPYLVAFVVCAVAATIAAKAISSFAKSEETRS